MKELAIKLKKDFEKNHYQSLISCKCKCGRFATIVMSGYVSGNTLYAILYCSKCNKFYKHHGGSSLGIDGETTYEGINIMLKYGSDEWKRTVNQIEQRDMFAIA